MLLYFPELICTPCYSIIQTFVFIISNKKAPPDFNCALLHNNLAKDTPKVHLSVCIKYLLRLQLPKNYL